MRANTAYFFGVNMANAFSTVETYVFRLFPFFCTNFGCIRSTTLHGTVARTLCFRSAGKTGTPSSGISYSRLENLGLQPTLDRIRLQKVSLLSLFLLSLETTRFLRPNSRNMPNNNLIPSLIRQIVG